MQLFFTADSFKKAIKKAKFGLFKMDSEIPPLIQDHKLRANQQFVKKEQKSTQVSAEC